MCLFTQLVESVSETQIFARLVAEGSLARQVLVYSMRFSAAEDLAMVLPIPTPLGSPEDSVRFVSLEDYPAFFEDMRAGFPVTASRASAKVDTLEVHQVGAFEASFVPGTAEFSRLDARFRLPDGVWKKLPGGRDYGFAVFKLRAGASQDAHPMALTFPTRNPNQIFFPTTHVHAGAYERRASFDHALYFQGSDSLRLPLPFDRGTGRFAKLAGQMFGVGGGVTPPQGSSSSASQFMKTDPERGLVDPDRLVYRFVLEGDLPNRDVALWPKYHPDAGNYP